MAVNDNPHRTLCPIAIPNQFFNFRRQGIFIQHTQEHAKQGAFFGHQRILHFVIQRLNFLTHGIQRSVEQFQFFADVIGFTVGYRGQICWWIENDRAAKRNPARAGNALEGFVGRQIAGFTKDINIANGMRMGNHARELGAERDQKGFSRFAKVLTFLVLHHQYAHDLTTVHDRHAEEGIINFFAGFR